MTTRFQVPPIDVRKRIPRKVIREIARQIAAEFHPQRIILFGSYAYGSPGPQSDLDLLVIMNTPLHESEQVQQIRRFLNPLFGLDVLVYTPENLARRLDWGDPFLKEIVEQGKVMYESTDI